MNFLLHARLTASSAANTNPSTVGSWTLKDIKIDIPIEMMILIESAKKN